MTLLLLIRIRRNTAECFIHQKSRQQCLEDIKHFKTNWCHSYLKVLTQLLPLSRTIKRLVSKWTFKNFFKVFFFFFKKNSLSEEKKLFRTRKSNTDRKIKKVYLKWKRFSKLFGFENLFRNDKITFLSS